MGRREEILKMLRERFTVDKNGECLAALHLDTIAKLDDQKAVDPVVFNEMFDPICLVRCCLWHPIHSKRFSVPTRTRSCD